jgi:hypothetical protein
MIKNKLLYSGYGIIEQGLPETMRLTFDYSNEESTGGTFVIFCINGKVEVKARGLTPEEIKEILKNIFS